jgi:hypothetical protein
MMQDVNAKLNPGLPCQRNIQGEEASVRQQIRLQFKEKLEKFYICSVPLLDADIWTFRTLKALKCGAGEGLRMSAELTV